MSQPTGVIGDGTKLILNRGALYIDRFNASGLRTGERFVGTTDSFRVIGSEETVEKRSMVDSANQLLARVPTKKTYEISGVLAEVDKDNLALALAGTTAAYTQTSGGLTDEIIAGTGSALAPGGTVQGNWYKASKRKFGGTVSLKDDDVAVTQAGNWERDDESGRIRVLPGGTIVDGSVLKLTVSAPIAITAMDQVNLGKAGTMLAGLRFVSDPMNGKILEVEIPRAQISPDGEIALLAEADFVTFPFKGVILSDAAFAGYELGRWFVR